MTEKMVRPLVSVIVSTYNAEEFIRECLQDLTGQTIRDRMEVIVVDACSLQNEKEIIEEYKQTYSNIKYIRTDHRVGIYVAWNIAIRASSGRYITPFSTNDRLHKNAYKVLSESLEKNPDITLVYGNSYLTGTAHESFDKHARIGMYEWPDYSYEELLQYCSIGPHPMWRSSVHDAIGYFDETYKALGDYEFWLRLGAQYDMLHIPVVTGLYWMEAGSLSLNKEDSEREISKCREEYQRKYMKRLNAGDNRYVLHVDHRELFEDRLSFTLNTQCSAEQMLREYYLGTRAETYVYKKDLQWFFDINFVSPEWMIAAVAGLYDLVAVSLADMGSGKTDPLEAVKAFVHAVGRNIKIPGGELKKKNRIIDKSLDDFIREILSGYSEDTTHGYSFSDNFLVPSFMEHVQSSGLYLCRNFRRFDGEGNIFIQSIYKTLGGIIGEALGAYYLYSESLNRISLEMIKLERMLTQREDVCYS